MADAPLAIEFQDVWFAFGATRVLEAVTFGVARGQFAALIGPNGAGKTTLLHLVLGLRRLQRGRILVFGRPLEEREPIGYIPQRVRVPRGFPLTVRELVLMGSYGRVGLGRRPTRRDRRVAQQALERVGLAELADRPYGALSGGQQQQVLIARALAGEPRLLLLDEPTTGLDPAARQRFYNLCCELQHESGITVVAASHDIDAVARHADSVILIRRRVIAMGPAESVLTSEVLHDAYSFPSEHARDKHPHAGNTVREAR
ncbi:MAG: metal ABC transporter ATP-binding protein [Kofleriaceae bacterium]